MGDSDALLWMIESDPMLRSTITAVVVLDGNPDRERVRAMLERGTRLIPRLRQRVRTTDWSIAPPRWESDPAFDIDYHLRFVSAPSPGDLRSVLDIAQPMAMAEFDRERPLWEATVVEGLDDDRAAIIMKIHHTITDGVGSMQLAMIMFDLERDPEPKPAGAPPPVHVLGRWQRWWDALDHERRRAIEAARTSAPSLASGIRSTLTGLVTDPLGTTRNVLDTAGSVVRLAAPAPKPLSPAMTGRSLSVRFHTFDLSLEEVKAASRAAGVTLNAAFLAAVAGGMANYHRAVGEPADALRFTVPINLRSDGEEEVAGNHVMLARVVLPLDVDDPIERMGRMHELITELRSEPALELTEPMAGVLRRLPTVVGTGVFGGMLRGTDLITTNVPGAPIPLYSAGSRVDRLIAFAPLLGAAVNLSLISYEQTLHIGINVDPAAVPDPSLLVESLRGGWDEILAIPHP